MNGRMAKRIRREVYGDDYSPRFREYREAGNPKKTLSPKKFRYLFTHGTITADPRRQAYQKAKKAYIKGAR